VVSQTHGDITHIVSYDNDKDLEYLNLYDDIVKVRVNTSQLVRDFADDPRRPSETPYGGDPHSPHNLYCNSLLEKVEDGWVMFLDDDDIINDSGALEKIVSYIENEDTIVYWLITLPGREICGLRTFAQEAPVLYDIGSPCFLFHSKWKHNSWWDEWKCSDCRFGDRLHKVIPNKEWVPESFVQVGGYGLGRRQDASVDQSDWKRRI